MGPLTAMTAAFCAVALGVAGRDAARNAPLPLYRIIVLCCGAIALLLTLTRLGEYLLKGPRVADAIWLPPMAPATAIPFVLISTTLLLIHRPWWARTCRTMAILAALSAWIGITRYLFGEAALGFFNRMAIQTSVSILLLSTGVLALRANQGLMALLVSGGPAGVSTRRLLPAAATAPFVIGALALYAERAGKLSMGQSYALVAITSVLIFAGLVWTSSLQLERMDNERKQAQTAQRASEERTRQIVESAMDAIVTKDLRGIVTSWNPAAERTFGYAAHEMIGQSITRIIPMSRLAEEGRILGSIGRGELIEHFETERLHKDGQIVPVSVTFSPIRDTTGRIIGASIVTRDITARKNADRMLRESDARFRLLAESLPQLIWTCNAQGRCDYLSRQWGDYTGIGADQPLDRSWLECVHPDDRPELASTWVAAARSGSDFHCEFRLRRHDGVYRWFSARGSPQRDENGGLTRWYGATTDIEDHRHAQEAQLRSQKMEALGTLAGGIAHDFNNILLAITGNTGLALEDLPPQHAARSSLLEVERASRRAADLVRRILAFSRKEEPRSETLYLQPVIEEALKLLRPTLPAQIQLRASFDTAVPATICDATQVHQILMNLSTNAAHAIGERPGSIEIKLTAATITDEYSTDVLRAGLYACLDVTDDGYGMSRQTLERIFDPFFTTKQTGTGLGLSMVHGIMKAHGGAVTVYSEPGRGTCFKLYFPATATAPAQTVTHEPPQLARASGQRVLYVDDDEALVMLTTRKLTRLGYEVTGETDPQVALARFRQDTSAFDAIVSDLSMPGMTGFELVREMLAVRANLPVIMTSGFVRAEDQMTAQQIGVRALILKPNTIDELGKLLERVFRGDSPQPGNPVC
jgi:PAS domain S-box-containing protein